MQINLNPKPKSFAQIKLEELKTCTTCKGNGYIVKPIHGEDTIVQCPTCCGEGIVKK